MDIKKAFNKEYKRMSIKKATPQVKRDPWAHRSKMMTCESCMWFVEKVPATGLVLLGRCRKNAPTMDGYPVVFKTDWCGKHKLDENRV